MIRIAAALLVVTAPVATASAQRADLDILFVVDNSGGMGAEQIAFMQAFPRLIEELDLTATGRPSIHIGIVSSDVGIGGYDAGGCSDDGDDGLLQGEAREGLCSPPRDDFISDELSPAGLRRTNYDGELADVFSCIAQLGTVGCGLEQHLEATKRALENPDHYDTPETNGFRRPGAYLAVIIVADEDDCSAEDSSVFDPSQDDLNDLLGPFGSFRCTEFGVQCSSPSAVIGRSAGSYSGCTAMDDSATNYLHHPAHYADFLKSLTADDPTRVYVGIIAGDPEPFNVVIDTSGRPELDPACETASGAIAAAPGVRFRSMVEQFDPTRAELASICSDGLAGPLGVIGAEIRGMLEAPPATPDAGPGGPGSGADDDTVGCGCQAGAAPPGGAGALLLALTLLMRRRRRA
jgi:MYXO-CTERM domain-containing protein